MIIVEIMGRCGNQMFMYSIARKMMEVYNEKVVFNDYILSRQMEEGDGFRFELGDYNTVPIEIIREKDPVMKYGSLKQKILVKFYNFISNKKYGSLPRPRFYEKQTAWQPFLNRHGIYSLIRGYSPIGLSKEKNKFVFGYFENEKWFEDIEDQIRKELTVKDTQIHDPYLLDKIKKTESVCVSIRRGDFFTAKDSGIRNVCNERYYKEAVKKMKELIPNAVLFFFSDDIEWVRNNMNFGIESYYESGNDSTCEKLRLMSSCRHFIMSNSTFCWWAQFLCQNTDKTVISPSRWFNLPGYKHDLIGEDWILIEADDDNNV